MPLTDALVLVVDDDPNIVLIAARILMRADFWVRSAFSGTEAMALLATPELAIACVVTDIVMPEPNGMAVGMQATTQGIPVVYMTGYSHTEVGRILAKPFSDTALVNAVRSAIWAQADAPASGVEA